MQEQSAVEAFRQQVLLAWARSLNLGDTELIDRFARSKSGQIASDEPLCIMTSTEDTPRIATTIELFGMTIIYGPLWFVTAAQHDFGAHMLSESEILDVTTSHGGRSAGSTALYYANHEPELGNRRDMITAIDMPEVVENLEHQLPGDELTGLRVSQLDYHRALLHPEADETENLIPEAIIGWEVHEGLLADLIIKVAPELRGQGMGSFALQVGIAEALAEGFIPQFRVGLGDARAEGMAEAAGMDKVGMQTVAVLP